MGQSAVIAIPIANLGRAPIFRNLSSAWEPGPLAVLNASGAPSAPVQELLASELPILLFAELTGTPRSHVSLWASPIALDHGVEIVAIESWASANEQLPDILMIHLVAPETGVAGEYIESLIRLNTVASKQFLKAVFIDAGANLLTTRGLGVLLRDGEHGDEAWTEFGTLVQYRQSITPAAMMFLHGRLAHVLLLLAIQQFGCLAAWQLLGMPQQTRDGRTIQDWFNLFDAHFVWSTVSHNTSAQSFFAFYRNRLGLQTRIDEFRMRLLAEYERSQTRSASLLNALGAVIGISALIATWIGAAAQIGWLVAAIGLSATTIVGAAIYFTRR